MHVSARRLLAIHTPLCPWQRLASGSLAALCPILAGISDVFHCSEEKECCWLCDLAEAMMLGPAGSGVAARVSNTSRWHRMG
jgi:hypothetical protein